jgi:hypothetical protein
MEGIGIWIFLLLFYLLQAITRNQQKKRRLQQQQEAEVAPDGESIEDFHSSSTEEKSIDEREEELPNQPISRKTQETLSFEDLLNPEKLRDILGVSQQKPEPKPKEKPIPEQEVKPKVKQQMRQRWEEPIQSKPSLEHEEARETVSKVASADITDVDETTADFKAGRLRKSDITSDRFDQRKEAPGHSKPQYALDYFDESEDIRNAVILKEILDRPRAFRRNIR